MAVTLRQLRYFQALVEHGSFSRAAESVHVSQPALSLQIRELETSLGGRLVERESRGFLLTPLGRDAHEQTLRILDETLLLETIRGGPASSYGGDSLHACPLSASRSPETFAGLVASR